MSVQEDASKDGHDWRHTCGRCIKSHHQCSQKRIDSTSDIEDWSIEVKGPSEFRGQKVPGANGPSELRGRRIPGTNVLASSDDEVSQVLTVLVIFEGEGPQELTVLAISEGEGSKRLTVLAISEGDGPQELTVLAISEGKRSWGRPVLGPAVKCLKYEG